MITIIECANKTGTRQQRSIDVDIDQTLNSPNVFHIFPRISRYCRYMYFSYSEIDQTLFFKGFTMRAKSIRTRKFFIKKILLLFENKH